MEYDVINIGIKPDKVISYSKNILLPSILLGGFFVYFYSITEYTDSTYRLFHTLFVAMVVISMLVASYFKLISSLMNVFLIYLSYIIINNMRYAYGEDYVFSSGYNIWIMLIIPNLFLILQIKHC